MALPNGNLLQVIKEEEQKAGRAIRETLDDSNQMENKIITAPKPKKVEIPETLEQLETRVTQKIRRFV